MNIEIERNMYKYLDTDYCRRLFHPGLLVKDGYDQLILCRFVRYHRVL